jgi:hypothetical protein
MSAKVQFLADRLAKLSIKRKDIEREEEDIRFELNDAMKDDEYIKLKVGKQGYRVMKERQEKRVLQDSQFIAKGIGKEAFLRIAKVSIGDLTAEVGKEEIGKFIHSVRATYTIVVREEKENGK